MRCLAGSDLGLALFRGRQQEVHHYSYSPDSAVLKFTIGKLSNPRSNCACYLEEIRLTPPATLALTLVV
jgi:hypothetical protein